MSLAIFDLDDTLTMQDTESLWQNFLVEKDFIPSHLLLEKKEAFRLAYEAGILNFADLIKFSLEPIGLLSLDQQLALQKEFVETKLKQTIIPQALDLVTSHYEQGHTVLIISAGHEFLIHPAAAFFPVHDVLCTRLQRLENGAYTHLISGSALYREQKVQSLMNWLNSQEREYATTYFYSDSINDLPLLEHVNIPIVVNPCGRLKVVAVAKNWPILELKELFRQQAPIKQTEEPF